MTPSYYGNNINVALTHVTYKVVLVMCPSNDCCIRVIHSLLTVLLEYIDLNEYSFFKTFVHFKFNESNSSIRNIRSLIIIITYVHIISLSPHDRS